MPRVQEYLDVDVLTAAKRRLHHIYDIFDSVTVSFSGGKDSLVLLELAREVAAERGLKTVDAFFLDPEFLSEEIVTVLRYYGGQPWCRLRWFCLPEASNRYILGRLKTIVLWGRSRPELFRPMPADALTLPAADPRHETGLTGDEIDVEVAKYYPGRICMLLGIRASESLMRLRAIVNKLHQPHITNPLPLVPRASRGRPIYDWQENDVLKLIFDRGLRYCELYDAKHLAGSLLRLDAPNHAESAKHNLPKIRQIEPKLYNRLIELFPDLVVQERYGHEFSPDKLVLRYGYSLDGVERYIRDRIDDPHQQAIALKSLRNIRGRSKARPRAYPPDRVLKYFITGAFHKELLPMRRS